MENVPLSLVIRRIVYHLDEYEPKVEEVKKAILDNIADIASTIADNGGDAGYFLASLINGESEYSKYFVARLGQRYKDERFKMAIEGNFPRQKGDARNSVINEVQQTQNTGADNGVAEGPIPTLADDNTQQNNVDMNI